MLAKVLLILRAILPTKKIAAWILGLIGAALALFVGVNNDDLKKQFCASDTVSLPVIAAPAVAPVAVPAPAEPVKK